MLLGVMAAMPEEAEEIVASLGGDAAIHHHGRRDFHRARWHGTDVIVVVSRCGKVAAAATAAELIVRFGVDAIIMTGVAGGLADGVDVGDVVVADTLMQHDLDASPLWPRHVVPLLEESRFPTDPTLTEAIAASAGAFVAERGVAVHRGLVVSGDVFVGDADTARSIRAALPGALCVEMEGAAVAQVAFEQGVRFAVVRGISDRADGEAAAHFAASLGTFAAAYGAGILRGALAHLGELL